MSRYSISGCLVNIHILSNNLSPAWEKFRLTRIEQDYFDTRYIFELKEIKFEEINRDIAFLDLENNMNYLMTADDRIILINNNYSLAYAQSSEVKTYNIFLCYLFYTHAVQRHMIQLHSSLIATTDNRGLMFLGPSGIGKTTQAELWHKYRDALIINGDIVFVQETDDAFLGWGTPWHGSSPYCENTNVPVEALIVLKQAQENSIRELTGFEKVSEVSNSVFYPRWLENGMELCFETLDHLLSKLPVYELRCRPDEDAVRLTEETIFKK